MLMEIVIALNTLLPVIIFLSERMMIGHAFLLSPIFSQKIADNLNCFLPTTKMVDDIHEHAKIKLAPIPLTEKRDHSNTMYQHHILIQNQNKKAKGIISGIKKDVVITDQLKNKPDRVAIYG